MHSRLLNNIAVSLYRQGEVEKARTLIGHSLQNNYKATPMATNWLAMKSDASAEEFAPPRAC
ncbi:MAG: hypothetical protein GY811_18770 [Myxococcales bacterium]|nr:hypothetical protein [Myxococcales bacterium]